MALLNTDGAIIETEQEWLEFFRDKLKFPNSNSAKYSKYLSSECFTSDTLAQCIDDPDMQSLSTSLKMPLGHFKKLKCYLKVSTPQQPALQNRNDDGRGGPSTPKISCPNIKLESTQLQFDQFLFEWKRYKSHYHLSNEQASTTLFFSCSEEIRQHIRSKQGLLGQTETWDENELLALIKEITTSRTSPIVHVQSFLLMKQESSENCQDFLRRLQIKASCCNFMCDSCKVSNMEKRVKEKFILGLKNKVIQTHILKTEAIKPDTPLNAILTEAITLEQSMLDQASLANDMSTVCQMDENSGKSQELEEVNAIARGKSYSRKNFKPPKSCNGCGTKEHRLNERSEKCRAWRVKCNFCGVMGHFSKVCRKKQPQESNVALAEGPDNSEMSCFVIGEVSSLHLPITASPLCHQPSASFKIDVFPDTGANICLLGPSHLKQMNLSPENINQCSHNISIAGGSTLVATGWLRVAFKLGDKYSEQKVYFSGKAKRFFLSRQTCIDLGVVPPSFPFPPKHPAKCVAALSSKRSIPKRPAVIPFIPTKENIPKLVNYLLEMFASTAFNGEKPFPKLSTPPAHIHLRHGYIIPRPAHWPATIADHWADEVKKAIDRDVELGILKKVPFNEPTIWCARMVVVKKKDGRPRRTVDYQQLNAQCVREPNYSQSPFHTARHIPHNTWKSVLDAVDGYHSVELDEESSRLTTFITPWGRYRYLRFPQGHCSAGDAFNGRVQEILSNIPRLVRLVDDICVYDDTIEGHFWHVWDLLETCAINGIVINRSKLQFCQKEIDFAGLTVTSEGVQPSRQTLSAIENFPPPASLTKARSFFGLVNQVQWAYANSREMTPFRNLVKPNSTYQWTEELKQLFNNCKEKILDQVRAGVRQYDINRITCLQTDFSRDGIGYLLLQKYCTCPLDKTPICCKDGWRLVFAGSRFTKGAEQRYAPTEGELLAVAWSLNHAHIFTKGCRNLIVSTDHKPLLGILNEKPLENIKNPRIVRMKEQTLSFNFVVMYNQGKWHRGPDALSRSPQTGCEMLELLCEDNDEEQVDEETDVLLALTEAGEDVNVDSDDLDRAVKNDSSMMKLMEAIKSGFPETQHMADPAIRPYFNVREHLWIQKGIIMYKKRLVIPKALRSNLLKTLHSAHQGVEGMKARASGSVYWPGLNEAIRQKRENCQICNTVAPSQPREPIQLIPPAEYPFQQICMDAFELANPQGITRHYLALVDRYSGWLEIFHIRCHPQCKHVVSGLRSVFSTYGVPETFYSDGGLPFQGREVEEFLKTWRVHHVTSSARYAQGNGRAELAVKSAKRLLRENTAPDGSLNSDGTSRALLQYRNTPLQHLGLSPAQLLFHRNLRDGLPVSRDTLKPNKLWVIAADQREKAFSQRNQEMITRYNRHTREMPVLNIGQDVSIQETDQKKRWLRFGTVVDRDNRKYTIKVHGSGRVISRNRRFLKPISIPDTTTDIIVSTTEVPENVDVDNAQAVQNVRNGVGSTEAGAGHPSSPAPRTPAPEVQGSSSRAVTLPRMLQRILPHNNAGLKE